MDKRDYIKTTTEADKIYDELMRYTVDKDKISEKDLIALEQTYPGKISFIKNDKDKPDISLVPSEAIIAIAKVMEHGKKKYGKDNWEQCDKDNLYRYYNAAIRHLLAYNDGELIDNDSNKPHLWHALCNVAFLVALTERLE